MSIDRLLLVLLSFIVGAGYASCIWIVALHSTIPFAILSVLGGVCIIVFFVYSFIKLSLE